MDMTMEEYKEKRAEIQDTDPEVLMARLREEASWTKKTIRASMIHAVIGASDMSRWEAYLEIGFGLKKPADGWLSNLQHFGNVNELSGVHYVEEVSGRMYFWTGDKQKRFRSDRWTCHPDGLDDNSICEVKSRAPTLEAYKQGDKNWRKHMPQLQQNMYLAGKRKALFGCYVVAGGSRCWEVDYHGEYIAHMHKLMEKFERMLDGLEPCPRRIGRKPKLPLVGGILIDGPKEQTELTEKVIAMARLCNTEKAIEELEGAMIKEHPGRGDEIAAGTQGRIETLERIAKECFYG